MGRRVISPNSSKGWDAGPPDATRVETGKAPTQSGARLPITGVSRIFSFKRYRRAAPIGSDEPRRQAAIEFHRFYIGIPGRLRNGHRRLGSHDLGEMHVAGGNPAAAGSRVQHQRAVLVEIDEATGDDGVALADLDPLAQPAC